MLRLGTSFTSFSRFIHSSTTLLSLPPSSLSGSTATGLVSTDVTRSIVRRHLMCMTCVLLCVCRAAVHACVATLVNTGCSSVSQHPSNLQFHPIVSTRLQTIQHLANRSWIHTSGQPKRAFFVALSSSCSYLLETDPRLAYG